MKSIMVIALTALGGCAYISGQEKLHEKAFHAKHQKIIGDHLQMLIDKGRIGSEEGIMASSILGEYGWHSGICDDGTSAAWPCQFGAYVFSQSAFEQALRGWWSHAQMEAGTDILIAVDGSVFDKSIVGYSVGPMSYCALAGGKLRHCDGEQFLRGATVIGFIDEHTLKLDKVAKYDTNMYGVPILPLNYVDMCRCH